MSKSLLSALGLFLFGAAGLCAASIPASVVAISGSGQSTSLAGNFSVPLQAVVKDANHLPVFGVTVAFTAPQFGPGALFGPAATVTATTNAQGVAIAPSLTANGVPGAFTVLANVTGIPRPAVFALFNAAPAGSLLSDANGPFGTAGVSDAIAAGDFNGDGFPDIAIASASGSLTVLLGNGNGGFTPGPKGPVAVGGGPLSIVAADFNLDGNLDLAVANSLSNNVSILLGDGTGAFNPAVDNPYAVGNHPVSIAAADLNGDGLPDLAIANQQDGTVSILLGNGSGGFVPAAGSPITVGTRVSFIGLGDLNGDGNVDIVATDNYQNQIGVFLGAGQGTFTPGPGSPFLVGREPFGVVLGDFNLDGKLDVAVTNELDNNLTVLLGDGTGKLNAAAGSPFASGDNPARVITADFNGDGFPDLAVISPLNDTLTILLGDGTGHFTSAFGTALGGGTSPGDIAFADFNGDGLADLAISNATAADAVVYLGSLTPTSITLQSSAPNGQNIPLSARLSESAASFAAPTGTVTFLDGKEVIGISSLTGDSAAFTAAGLAAGPHTLTAVYNGDARTEVSTSASLAAIVSIAPDSPLSFGSIPSHVFGDPPFALHATSGSAAPILFAVLSGPAIVTSNMVTITGAGTVTIQASQPASGASPAASATQTFQIAKSPQTIMFKAIGAANINDHTETLQAMGGGSTSPVVFSVVSGPVSISGNSLTLLGLGTAVIEASQAGDNNFLAAPSVIQGFNIVNNLQAIFFYPISAHLTTDAPFTIKATGGPSGNPVVFTVVSGPAAVSGDIVTLTGSPGTVTIQATQAGNLSYSAAPAVTQSFAVSSPAVSLTAAVNAASYQPGALAPDSFGTLYGAGFASATAEASSMPYPLNLGGVSVQVTDSSSNAQTALLQYVSPTQVNFVVPSGLAPGAASAVVSSANGSSAAFRFAIANVAPGLFSADGSGTGAAAGFALSVAADGSQSYALLASCGGSGCQPAQVPAGAQYLVLYGTGFRNRSSLAGVGVSVGNVSATVLYAGPQSQFPGLDQLNIQLPAGLSGLGVMPVKLTVDGSPANTVNVLF